MEEEAIFWSKVAGFAFTLWAVMIPIGVSMIRGSIARTMLQQADFLKDFHEYVLQTERRLTVLEERSRVTDEVLDKALMAQVKGGQESL